MREQLGRISTSKVQIVGGTNVLLDLLEIVTSKFGELIALVQEDQTRSDVLPEALFSFRILKCFLKNVDIEFDNLRVMSFLAS